MPSLQDSLEQLESLLPPPTGGNSIKPLGSSSFPLLLEAFFSHSIEQAKVPRALESLENQGLLDPQALAEADIDEIRMALENSNVRVNPKTVVAVKKLAKWTIERWRGDFDAIEHASAESIREELRQINGIGPALADSLLLHGLNKPAYPVDRGSYRIFLRHGWIDSSSDYDEARAVFERLASRDFQELKVWSASLEKLARDYCKPTTPKCDRCPLREVLPESGPVDPG